MLNPAKLEKLGPAAIFNQNPIFERASYITGREPADSFNI
jgi:hypothetical protein